MIRQALTILSLIGFLITVGVWLHSIPGLSGACGCWSLAWGNVRIAVVRGQLTCVRQNDRSLDRAIEKTLAILDGPVGTWGQDDHCIWAHLTEMSVRSLAAESGQSFPDRCGIAISRGTHLRFAFGADKRYRVSYGSLPLWLPAVLFSVLPAFRLCSIIKRRRRQRCGLCVNCGYDLQGLTSARCPECAMPFDECKVAPT